VTISALLAPWSEEAYRHIPEGSTIDVLDFRFAGLAADNRWNAPGESTLYLARDDGVAIAEFARHLEEDRTPALKGQTTTRQLYRLRVMIDRILDLRKSSVLEALSIENAPYCFLDKAVARATARYLRTVTPTQGILVPSIAFLDDPERWVSVLFLEKLPPDPRAFVTSVELDRVFRFGPPTGAGTGG
jgi:RES domain-containing protein